MNFKPQIEIALGELSIIIDSDESESAFQQWLERNEIVFRCLGYKRVIPHPILDRDQSSNDTYIPDFMAINNFGVWEIIEIKPANASIIKNTARRHSLRSTVESYISQCGEYADLFMDKEYRDRFNKKYGADCHKTPDVTLIIGRNEGVDKKILHEILSHRSSPKVTIKTYDDVRNGIYYFSETAHGLSPSAQEGICIVFCAILLPQPENQINYIVDISKKTSSERVCLYVEDGKICLDVTDKDGNVFKSKTNESDYCDALETPLSFAIQISDAPGYSCIDLLMDDRQILEIRRRGINFDFKGDLEYVIGSDQTGSYPSSMLFGGLVMFQVIPPIEDRWVIRSFISEVGDGKGGKFFHEYIGNKFMHTPNHSRLGGSAPVPSCIIQENDAKKPILRMFFVNDGSLKLLPASDV